MVEWRFRNRVIDSPKEKCCSSTVIIRFFLRLGLKVDWRYPVSFERVFPIQCMIMKISKLISTTPILSQIGTVRQVRLSGALVASLFLSLRVASGEVSVSDLGAGEPGDLLTGYTGNFSGFVGMSAGDEVAQSFSLDQATELGAIVIGYRGFDDGGRFATAKSGVLTIRVDAGNDGSDEIVETVTLDEVDFSGDRFSDTPPGFGAPPYWMKWDLSSSALVLPAGESRFRISMDSQSAGSDTWLFAICFSQGDPYSEGEGWSLESELGDGRDLSFAITGAGEPTDPLASRLRILDTDYSGDGVSMTVGGLNPEKSYVLKRSLDLETFLTVGEPFTPDSSVEIVSDPMPTGSAAFYQIEEAP